MLWRVSTNLRLEASHRFADGSHLAQVYDHTDRRREQGVTVRMIEYMLDDPSRPGDLRYRLLTNILEPARAPSLELAALHTQRWEFERPWMTSRSTKLVSRR